jgi:hypothetical protein
MTNTATSSNQLHEYELELHVRDKITGEEEIKKITFTTPEHHETHTKESWWKHVDSVVRPWLSDLNQIVQAYRNISYLRSKGRK